MRKLAFFAFPALLLIACGGSEGSGGPQGEDSEGWNSACYTGAEHGGTISCSEYFDRNSSLWCQDSELRTWLDTGCPKEDVLGYCEVFGDHRAYYYQDEAANVDSLRSNCEDEGHTWKE